MCQDIVTIALSVYKYAYKLTSKSDYDNLKQLVWLGFCMKTIVDLKNM